MRNIADYKPVSISERLANQTLRWAREFLRQNRTEGEETNTLLENQVQTLMEFIYDLAPEVQIEPTNVISEDEHANLDVYPPLTWSEDECLELQHRIAKRTVNVLVDSGYFILAYVYTPEQQIELAQYKLTQVQQQWESANRVLHNAAALGLFHEAAPTLA